MVTKHIFYFFKLTFNSVYLLFAARAFKLHCFGLKPICTVCATKFLPIRLQCSLQQKSGSFKPIIAARTQYAYFSVYVFILCVLFDIVCDVHTYIYGTLGRNRTHFSKTVLLERTRNHHLLLVYLKLLSRLRIVLVIHPLHCISTALRSLRSFSEHKAQLLKLVLQVGLAPTTYR